MSYNICLKKRESFAKQYCQLVTVNLVEEFHSTMVCVDISVNYQASSVTQTRNPRIQAILVLISVT